MDGIHKNKFVLFENRQTSEEAKSSQPELTIYESHKIITESKERGEQRNMRQTIVSPLQILADSIKFDDFSAHCQFLFQSTRVRTSL